MLKTLVDKTHIKYLQNGRRLFFLYLFSIGIVYAIECIMSYIFPIIAEKSLHSNFSVGLLIGLTNIVALACDLIFPQLFEKKSWKFLFLAGVLLQIGFPSFAILGAMLSFGTLFIVAAIFWNIYFEFYAFARQSFIFTNEKKEDFSSDWGMISVMVSLNAILGPIIGSALLEIPLLSNLITFGLLQIISLIVALILIATSANHDSTQNHKIRSRTVRRLHILQEFSFWEVIGGRILPVLILGTIVTIIVASVQTVGGLFGTQLFKGQGLDWIILVVFNLPAIFSSLLITKFKIKSHKKRISQIMLILGSIPLILLTFLKSDPIFAVILFLSCSIFISSAWVFNEAVFCDLSKRAKSSKLHISGMGRINDSLGYLFGPIIIGFLADKTDYFTGFSILGLIGLITGIILLIITPTKLKLPETELLELEKETQR